MMSTENVHWNVHRILPDIRALVQLQELVYNTVKQDIMHLIQLGNVSELVPTFILLTEH